MPVSENFLYDRRVQERNVARGLISKEQLDAHMKALPDRKDESEITQVQIVRVEARVGQRPPPMPAPVIIDDDEDIDDE